MVLEDPQAVTLASECLRDCYGVGVGDTDQQNETGTIEGTDHMTFDPHLSTECSLKENAHMASVP